MPTSIEEALSTVFCSVYDSIQYSNYCANVLTTLKGVERDRIYILGFAIILLKNTILVRVSKKNVKECKWEGSRRTILIDNGKWQVFHSSIEQQMGVS